MKTYKFHSWTSDGCDYSYTISASSKSSALCALLGLLISPSYEISDDADWMVSVVDGKGKDLVLTGKWYDVCKWVVIR